VIVEELQRYTAGVPLQCRVSPETVRHSAHVTPDAVDPGATHELMRSR
jgi:hypothetical protein